MPDIIQPDNINEEDYRAIEEAVMETARGRWFLAEYAKRNRVSDTDRVLHAIEGLKSYISSEHEPPDVLQMRLDIVDMTQTIDQIKYEIADTRRADGTTRMMDATNELDAVIDETETATSSILAAAEKVQETAWEMREAGAQETECETLDQLATEIYTACSFQDVTGQRLRKVVQVISFMESRLKSMVEVWGEQDLTTYEPTARAREEDAGLLNGPALPGQAKEQSEIDTMMMQDYAFADPSEEVFQIEWGGGDGLADGNDDDKPFLIDDEHFELDDIYDEIEDDEAEQTSSETLEPLEIAAEEPVKTEAPPAETHLSDEKTADRVEEPADPRHSDDTTITLEESDEETIPLSTRIALFG
ncbi:MAG: protein phosphatase CheZ [Pseudomonadota bacterium]